MLFRHTLKIDDLVEEVLDALPRHVWLSTTTTFCDPAMGGGQFLRAVIRRLLAHGHSPANISKRIFGFESGQIRLTSASKGMYGTFQVATFDDLKEMNMKFDVVIGNPPFNDTSTQRENRALRGQGNNLAKKFALLAIQMSRKYTSLILPYGNRVYSTGVAETFRKAGLYKIVPTKFSGIDISVGIYHFDHSKVVDKVDDGFITGLEIPKDNVTKYGYRIHAGRTSVQDFEHLLKDKGKYKIVLTVNNIQYTNDIKVAQNVKDKTYGHWRVAVNTTAGYKLGKVLVVEPTTYLCKNVNVFVLKNKTEAQRLKKHLEQPFVDEILAKVKTSVSNSAKFLQYIKAPF